MKQRFYTLFLLVPLFLFGCKEDTPAPAIDTDHTYTYLALGDSYTIGESVAEADRWGVLLAGLLRESGVDVGNPYTIARTGWTTSELSSAIRKEGLKQQFDLVSLMIGVNNQYRKQSISTYRSEFRELLQTSISLAKGDPSNVIVLSIPNWAATPYGSNFNREQITEEIAAFNAVAADEAQKADVTFVNITSFSEKAAEDRSLVASDGLHYSGKMHLEWAKLAFPEAQNALK
ncbi:SGNH/GDSL hydrolase family protein [Pontibacter cellulosilyticus]|uniref:SGNH/GDSL hydrolase family protein n=1 Tax=Pontibacter cellulosilyticus TaxID=1720253 RepID=A0A923N755_9BACT|nr:SGNH/GDSL hydrolase family protein [Pontibacter cellulosilyticus]MBC5993424.1 SGNH/GDSL hydrolase family protein [Pontibacter cellulosilyticus]